MKFLFLKTVWNHLELAVFKICVFAAGMFVGSMWNENIEPYRVPLLSIVFLSATWVIIMWIAKLEQARHKGFRRRVA